MQTFSELPLSPEILRAIQDLGYEKPSPIQAQALPILLAEPTDFLGLAGTGTGKTAAFAIPLLERVEPKRRAVQALILCPTRELAVQVAGQINLLGKHKGIRSVAVYGGASYVDQIRGLQQGATIVVGTPGRVVDHVERGTLRLDDLKTLVLDEADEMFSMGFKEELETVLTKAPRESCQIWLFSATMSRDVRRVADAYLRTPKQVQVNREEMLSSGVEQYYYPTQERDKPEILCKLIEAADDFYGLIFCQTKALVADLSSYLQERGYKVDCLHGDKDQTSRERTMQAFRDRKVSILVCTDVASRGLDVKDITHVINYSLPRELDSYVHRIGRTARSGKTGVAMNLVTFSHRRLIYQIEQMTKSRMLEGRIPTRREIGARKVAKLLPRFEDQPHHQRVMDVIGEEWTERLATMAPAEVASRFVAMMMPEIFGESGGRSEARPAPPVVARPAATASTVARPSAASTTVKPSAHKKALSIPAPSPVATAARKHIGEEAETPLADRLPSKKATMSSSAPSTPKPAPKPKLSASASATAGKDKGKPKAKGKAAPYARIKRPSEKVRELEAEHIPLLSRRARRAEQFGRPYVPNDADRK